MYLNLLATTFFQHYKLSYNTHLTYKFLLCHFLILSLHVKSIHLFFLVSKLCRIKTTVDFYDYKNAWLFHFDKTTADYYRSHNKKMLRKV